jgi:hypothetical protein
MNRFRVVLSLKELAMLKQSTQIVFHFSRVFPRGNFSALAALLCALFAASEVSAQATFDPLGRDSADCVKARKLRAQRRFDKAQVYAERCRVRIEKRARVNAAPPVTPAPAANPAAQPKPATSNSVVTSSLSKSADVQASAPDLPAWAATLPEPAKLRYVAARTDDIPTMRRKEAMAEARRLIFIRYVEVMGGIPRTETQRMHPAVRAKVIGYSKAAWTAASPAEVEEIASLPLIQSSELEKELAPALVQGYRDRVWKAQSEQEAVERASASPMSTVFGIRLGTTFRLPECDYSQMSMATMQAVLSGQSPGALQGGATCTLSGLAGNVATSDLELPSELQSVAVRLGAEDCPDWVFGCYTIFSLAQGKPILATINTKRSQMESVLTRKYDPPTERFVAQCTSGLKAEGLKWQLKDVKVTFNPFATHTCAQGLLQIETRAYTEISKAREETGPQL